MGNVVALHPHTANGILANLQIQYKRGVVVSAATLAVVIAKRLKVHPAQAEEMAEQIVHGQVPQIPLAILLSRCIIAHWRCSQYMEPMTGRGFMVNQPPAGEDEGVTYFDEGHETRERDRIAREITTEEIG